MEKKRDIRDYVLDWLHRLPVWKQHRTVGLVSSGANRGKQMIVTWREVWFFGWTKYVTDVRLLEED